MILSAVRFHDSITIPKLGEQLHVVASDDVTIAWLGDCVLITIASVGKQVLVPSSGVRFGYPSEEETQYALRQALPPVPGKPQEKKTKAK